jgi:hypothetical protein
MRRECIVAWSGRSCVSIKTSSSSNPKPGTLLKVNQRGPSEYVVIGGYRIRQQRMGGGWHLYISTADGWGRPRWYSTRKNAAAAIAEHMATGTAPRNPLTVEQRLATLEAFVRAIPGGEQP